MLKAGRIDPVLHSMTATETRETYTILHYRTCEICERSVDFNGAVGRAVAGSNEFCNRLFSYAWMRLLHGSDQVLAQLHDVWCVQHRHMVTR